MIQNIKNRYIVLFRVVSSFIYSTLFCLHLCYLLISLFRIILGRESVERSGKEFKAHVCKRREGE